jgi:hypothetical protein
VMKESRDRDNVNSVSVNVNTTDATAGATALLLPAQNTYTLHECEGKHLISSSRVGEKFRISYCRFTAFKVTFYMYM